MRRPSPFSLLQETSALLERVNNLQAKAKPVHAKVGKLLGGAADALAAAYDELNKEVLRRRALKKKYEQELHRG